MCRNESTGIPAIFCHLPSCRYVWTSNKWVFVTLWRWFLNIPFFGVVVTIHTHRPQVTYPGSVEWGRQDFFFPLFLAQWCLEDLNSTSALALQWHMHLHQVILTWRNSSWLQRSQGGTLLHSPCIAEYLIHSNQLRKGIYRFAPKPKKKIFTKVGQCSFARNSENPRHLMPFSSFFYGTERWKWDKRYPPCLLRWKRRLWTTKSFLCH